MSRRRCTRCKKLGHELYICPKQTDRERRIVEVIAKRLIASIEPQRIGYITGLAAWAAMRERETREMRPRRKAVAK